MSGSSDPELLRRLVDFELSLERDSSEIVEEFDWGRADPQPRDAGHMVRQLPRGSLDRPRCRRPRGARQRNAGTPRRDRASGHRARGSGPRKSPGGGIRGSGGVGGHAERVHGPHPGARPAGWPGEGGRARRGRGGTAGRCRGRSGLHPGGRGATTDSRRSPRSRRERALVHGARRWTPGHLVRALRAGRNRPGRVRRHEPGQTRAGARERRGRCGLRGLARTRRRSDLHRRRRGRLALEALRATRIRPRGRVLAPSCASRISSAARTPRRSRP